MCSCCFFDLAGWPELSAYAALSMNRFVFANEVKQSMTSECMDCRATLAVTKSRFKVRVRYRAGFGRLAMTKPVRL